MGPKRSPRRAGARLGEQKRAKTFPAACWRFLHSLTLGRNDKRRTLGRNDKMIIDQHILDELTARAKESPRLLNAIEPGTVLPIHRHRTTSETVVCLRGHFVEYFYDGEGRQTDAIDMVPGGTLINIPIGQWHTVEVLESGTVILECKDGPYVPIGEEDILNL